MRKLFFLFLTLVVSSVFIPAASAEPIAYTISSPNLIVSTFKPSGTLDFTFSLTTNNPTSEPVYCYIDAFINPFEATRVSGTSKNGNYSCSAQIPEKPMELFPGGKYPFDVLVVYFDEFGKQELRQTFGYISFPTPTPTPTPTPSPSPSPSPTPTPTGFAASGISNLQFSTSNLKINDVFTLEFEVNRIVVPDQKYQIVVGFSSLRDQFFGNAELYEGDHASGKWRAKITVPGNIYSGDFALSFSVKGSQENNKSQLSSGSQRIGIQILGKPVPIPPLIEIFNVKTDKQIYTGGSIIRISFETKIVYGKPNEETSDPQVSLWDLRDNYYLRPTTNKGKPIIATGNYTTGKWTLDYPIQPLTLSTTAQVYVNTPRGYDSPDLTTKGEVIQIQGLVNEIKISDVKLDQENYEPKSKVRVTFSTSASETTLHSANKPFIILTDLERSDLSANLETTLISGTLNDGRWMAEFNAPEINQSVSPKNSYLLGFYNSSGSIREIGPELRIRKSQVMRLVEPSTLKLILGTDPIRFEVESLSTLPITTNVSSPNICQFENGKLFLLASGLCEIISSAPGNEEWAEAQLKASLLVSNQKKSTITCVKGKLTKKVTAVKPRCPAGYKKK